MKLRLRRLGWVAALVIATASAKTQLSVSNPEPAELSAEQRQALASVACLGLPVTKLHAAWGWRVQTDTSGELHANALCAPHRFIQSHEISFELTCNLADTGWKCRDPRETLDISLPQGHVFVPSFKRSESSEGVPIADAEAIRSITDLVAAGNISLLKGAAPPDPFQRAQGTYQICSISRFGTKSALQIYCGSFHGIARRVSSVAELRYEVVPVELQRTRPANSSHRRVHGLRRGTSPAAPH